MPTTSVLATFSLSDLCGCGSDCAACCGITTICCGITPINRTLYATANVTTFGCASQVVTLTYSDTNLRWEGLATFPCGAGCGFTTPIYFYLSCMNPGTGYNWYLTITCDNVAATTQLAGATSCSPFSLSFTLNTPLSGCGSCPGNTLSVTITQ